MCFNVSFGELQNIMKIPKIIHQVWSGIDGPLPDHFSALAQTWKEKFPDWEYIVWNNKMMTEFIENKYLEYKYIYNKFPYNVQRWDAIRYLILYEMGGMYVDFDYECVCNFEGIVKDKLCCFALEPSTHCKVFKRPINKVFNNALMLSTKGHPFMRKIIDNIFTQDILEGNWQNKEMCVLNTTGPWKLIDLYETLSLKEKEDIYLIPAKYVTPFDVPQAIRLRRGEISDELEHCLEEAYAVHYFFGNWRFDNK